MCKNRDMFSTINHFCSDMVCRCKKSAQLITVAAPLQAVATIQKLRLFLGQIKNYIKNFEPHEYDYHSCATTGRSQLVAAP